jgi:hypothetical protein
MWYLYDSLYFLKWDDETVTLTAGTGTAYNYVSFPRKRKGVLQLEYTGL